MTTAPHRDSIFSLPRPLNGILQSQVSSRSCLHVGGTVSDYEASAFIGIDAPRNTPTEIVNTFNKEIYAAFADPKIGKRFAELGGTPLPGSPTDFGKMIAEETGKCGKVVRFAGMNLLIEATDPDVAFSALPSRSIVVKMESRAILWTRGSQHESMHRVGGAPRPPTDFANLFANEMEKWVELSSL